MILRIKRLYKSFGYALRGLAKVIREEQNFRIELFSAFVVLTIAIFLRVNNTDLAILILTIGIVLLTEVLNSIVEALTDLLKPKLDHYVKTIKDIAAALVAIAALISVIVGIIIFVKYLP